MRKTILLISLFSYLTICLLSPKSLHAEENVTLPDGQTVYVPAYSHIYSGDREVPVLLTVTLSIRNVDRDKSIKVTKVDYYETQGKLVRNYIESPANLNPLESIRYVIARKDKAGGSGANFIVEWESNSPVNPPIIEAIMIATESQQGISFTSRGQPLK